MINFADYFDQTILSPVTTPAKLEEVCKEAVLYGFHSVAVNTGMIPFCAEYLAGSGVKADAAVGFPLGISTVDCKLFEAEEAINNGAGEIDYVVNIGRVKCGDYRYITDEMSRMVGLCRKYNVVSKVIFENCYLTTEEKQRLCRISLEVKPDFIKTSTGFGTGGATVEDVRLMKSEVGGIVKIKAAGGIRNLETCLLMINAGAERIGCSASAAILNEYKRGQIK